MTPDRARDALLVIDLQPDFMPGGALPVAGGDEIVAPIAALLPSFDVVVATQDWHPRGHASFASLHERQPFEEIQLHGHPQTLWPDHCLQGSAGAELHPGLPREPLKLILRKGWRRDVDSYSAFQENFGPDGARPSTGLAAWLRELGIRRVFLTGLARDVCLLWSAQDAVQAGFETILLDSLTRPVYPERSSETDAAYAKAGVRRVASLDAPSVDASP